jgi:phosphoserine phosphatase RsbU/P
MPLAGVMREAALFAPRPRFVFRYIFVALLFAVVIFFQIGFTRAVLREVPADVTDFMPRPGTASIKVTPRALRAGLNKDDILVAINGRPYTGLLVWIEERATARPGETMRVTVRSPGTDSKERTVALPVTQSRSLLDTKAITVLFLVLMPAFCIALGFWVVLVRPADLSAWLLLGILLGFSQVVTEPQALLGWGPKVVPFAAGYSETLESAWFLFMFLFGFYFPEPLPIFQRPGTSWRWLPAIVAAPFVILCAGEVILFVLNLSDYRSMAWLARVLNPLEPIVAVYLYVLLTGFFGLIFFKSTRAISPDSRRRLRLLYWGATIAMTPGLVVVLWAWLFSKYEIPNWALSIPFVMLALFPLTLAYVIVVQRAMDVRVVLRQGLQYALAKNGIRVLQVAALGFVVLTFVALSQRLDTAEKLVVIGVGLGAVFIIRRVGDRARDWVDRRFFREAYDAELILSELGDSVRSMVEVPRLLATVAERISQTLHISQIAVLLGGGGPYRPAYALGYPNSPDIAFPPGAGTVKVLQRQGGPARVYFDDPQSWLHREPEVTDDDRSMLAELQSELLLPLNGHEKLLGFISLGPKRSDEPYSRTDLRLLKSVATQTGLALENAHLISAIADEVAQRERLNSELEIARDVQERLFPQKLAPIPGIKYAGACRPALGVGGDYYDFLALPGGRLGIAIGDVSGKGIAAALTMASLQASLRSEATRGTDNLAGLMCSVNRLLHEALASNRYATFFYGQYDPESRLLTYVNAGHNPPMLFHGKNGDWAVTRLEACGTVVGIVEEAYYEQHSLTIAPGDVLVGFTDGISEAMNEAQDEFGEERLLETVRSCARQSPTEIIACVMAKADGFAAGAKQYDDMTLVVLCAQTEGVAVPHLWDCR